MSADPEYAVPEGVIPDASPSVPPPAAPAPPSTPPAGASSSDGTPPQFSEGANQRIQALVAQRREIEAAAAEARAEAKILRQQVEALTGVKAQQAEDPQRSAIKAALLEVFPQLRHLERLPLDRMQELFDTVPQLQAQAQSNYDSLADQTVAALYKGASAEIYGGRELSPKQQGFIHKAFVSFVEEDPRHTTRYMYRDQTLVTDFLKFFTAEMLDPVRRQAAVTVGARAARTAVVPTGGGGSGPVGTPPPTVPKDEDSLHDAAWTAMKGRLGV